MKVLVAIDGTDSSRLALKYIEDRIWSPTDEFLIVSVVEPFADIHMSVEEDNGEIDYEVTISESCEEIISTSIERLRQKLPEHRISSTVLTGSAAEQIVQCASDWSADLIVLGTRGRSDCRRFLPSSVAQTVLKQAPCSVEVVKLKRIS